MISLRQDQLSLIGAARDRANAECRSILLQAPCGFGKTICFSWLAEQVASRSKRVVIIVHREELIEQVSRTLTQFHVSHGFIASGRYFQNHRQVYVASIWTLAKRLSDIPAPDLVILDEAHHAVARSWRTVLEAWPDAWRLGVTATPERLDGSGLRDTFRALVCGPSVRSLIEAGHLSEFKLYAPPVDRIDVPTRAGDYARDALAAFMDRPKLTGSAVEHYARLAPGKRAVVFCVSLDHAAHVAAEFQAAGYLAERIDGNMDRVQRAWLVQRFTRGEIAVLTSCEVVSEGFDLPAIEVAILLRPTQSVGLYLQQVGRALRPWPGKTHALILDHAGNALKHGMPDEERDWSLNGRPKQTRKALERVEAIRVCMTCFAAARLTATACPHCGTAFVIKTREVKQVEGELEQITLIERRNKEQGLTRSFEGLLALGQKRYGAGKGAYWAKKVWAARRH